MQRGNGHCDKMQYVIFLFTILLYNNQNKDRNTSHVASRVLMSEFVHFNEGNLAEQKPLSFTH